MILKDIDYLVTQNDRREILRDVDIWIEAGRIERIGKNLGGSEVVDCSGEVVDCSGKAVLPGLINAHAHMELTPRRGVSDDKPLFEWFADVNVDGLPGEWKRDAVAVSAIEMLRTGTTCVNDCYNTDPETLAAIANSGIRAVLSSYLVNNGDNDETLMSNQLSDAVAFHETAEEIERVTPALGPHSIYGCTPEFLERIAETAADLDATIHVHLAETETEREDCLDDHGRTPVEHLRDTNVLERDVVAAHCVHVDESDRRILAANDVGVVHCPCSNMKLGAGRCPLPELAETDGLPVGIGTDGVPSNNNFDLFEEAKIASLLQKERDPTVATAQQILDHLTIEGAAVLGKADEIGSVVPGKKADLVCIDLDDTRLTPRDPDLLVSHLVFSFTGPVETTIVGGEIVVENGEVLGLDRRKVVERLEEALATSDADATRS